jgi:predicted kinase
MHAVIFTGVQGSGKTTFYEERFRDSHVRISLDVLGTRPRERALLEKCLANGQPFVVDNTNPQPVVRAPYIAAARQARFRVTGYFFETALKDALRRNAQRKGRGAIPVPGVIGTFKRLEPPTFSEGYDELFTVTHGEDGRFVVAEQERTP